MHISLVGVNHQTAPIAIREKAAISADKLYDSLSLLRSYIPRVVIVSTCNRTEVYTTDSAGQHAREASLNFLTAHLDIPDAGLHQCVYISDDEAAIEHLFRVASGLDSMIVGEFEVLGQVKHALEVAEKAGTVDLLLRLLFQNAIRTGRRVRDETGISKNALSISSVAMDLAAKVVGNLQDCRILVIGAGEAGRLVAKAAKDRGNSQIVVANRTQKRAATLAATLDGRPIGLNNLAEELSTCSIVVTCAAAPRSILDFDRVEAAMKTRPESPLVIVDIAVPRNVEPTVGQINKVFLYNIDDLTQISERNRKQREAEVQKAEEIIAAEAGKFTSWCRAVEVRPVVSALMRKADDIRRRQLNMTFRKLRPLSDEERYSLEAMTKAIVRKMLHDPIQCLKRNADSKVEYAQLVHELFHLEGEESE